MCVCVCVNINGINLKCELDLTSSIEVYFVSFMFILSEEVELTGLNMGTAFCAVFSSPVWKIL